MGTASSSIRATLVLGLAVLGLATTSVQADPATQMPPPKVGVLTLAPQDVDVFANYPGRAVANREVQVRAQVSGILLGRDYVEGASVEAGQPLFRIDPRVYEARVNQARADLHNANARLARAQRDWERISSLYARNVASEKDRDDAKSALEVAKAGVEVANAQLEAVNIDLDYTTVLAPIAGVAGLRQVSEGNLINTGDLLTTITEVDPIQVQFTYSVSDPFADAPALRAGPDSSAPARVELSDGTALSGRINFHDVRIDPATDTIRARALFDNPDRRLSPNAFVRIQVKVDHRENVIVIPEAATASGPEPGSRVVWVVNERSQASQRPVTLGPMTEKGVIVEEGLSPGERIVVRGIVKLREGMTVDVGSDDADTGETVGKGDAANSDTDARS